MPYVWYSEVSHPDKTAGGCAPKVFVSTAGRRYCGEKIMREKNVMVYIVYDRAIDEELSEILDTLGITYYTKVKDVTGVGRNDPHLGDHIWPGLNNMLMIVLDNEKKDALLEKIRSLQSSFASVGLRAFVVPVQETI
jgi:nitrogen regulatory protein PII